jgi:hypothetical protein
MSTIPRMKTIVLRRVSVIDAISTKGFRAQVE